MDTTPISSQPSVDDLLGRLQEEHERLSALRQGVIHGVPRPPFIIRLLLLAAVALIGSVTVLIILVGLKTIRVADAIKLQRNELKEAEQRLPSGRELCDPAVLESALARHPVAAARLYAARAAAQFTAGDARGAVASFASAREHAVAPLAPEAQLTELEALIAAGQRPAARERLLAIDLGSWPTAERARAVALMPGLLDATYGIEKTGAYR